MDRILRRETRSSRAVVATAAAVLVMVLAAYGLLEAAVHAIGQPAWLIEPQVAAERLVALPAGIPPLLLGAIGAVLAMAGLVFLLNGILPTSGVPVNQDAVLAAVRSEVDAMALDPLPEVRVNVATSGVIGA